MKQRERMNDMVKWLVSSALKHIETGRLVLFDGALTTLARQRWQTFAKTVSLVNLSS